jgi:dipeptidyl aminopeptidase/acylaminoacyl peptidase
MTTDLRNPAKAPSPAPTPESREARYKEFLKIPSLLKGGYLEAHWIKDGDSFWYVAGAPDETAIFVVHPEQNTVAPLFEVERLRAALRSALGKEPPSGGVPFTDFSFTDERERAVRFTVERRVFTLQLGDYALSEQPAPSAEEKERTTARPTDVGRKVLPAGFFDTRETLSPDGRWFAGASAGKLYLRSTAGDQRVIVNEDVGPNAAWETYRASWSPDSRRLAAPRVDYTGCTLHPVVHWLSEPESVDWAHIFPAGSTLPRAEWHIIDVATRKATPIQGSGVESRGGEPVAWTADSSKFFYVRSARYNKKLELILVDALTGATWVVLTETQPTFVRLFTPQFSFGDFTLLRGDERFLWLSERDGWTHIYLYQTDGTLVRQLTHGEYVVLSVIAVDEANGWAYYTAHGDRSRPYDTHVYRVSLEGGEPQQLTEARGQHDVPQFWKYMGAPRREGIQLSPSRRFFVDTHSDTDRPPRSELRRADGTLVRTLVTADTSRVEALGWQPPQTFVVKAADGTTDLYGQLYTPTDFDPSRQYPVLEYIYGGPQLVHVPGMYADRKAVICAAWAELGFVVIMLDARGTPDRGKAFQDVVYGAFGKNEIPDHVAALTQLAKTRPYMDMSRVGVFGGSWGGYFAVRAMLQAPETYHVGVADRPVMDVDTTPAEPWMGSPEDNPEGYAQADSHKIADQLRGKLLLIGATSDINAVFSQTIKFVEALTRAERPYDLALLVEQNHAPTGVYQRYAEEAATRYLVEHLRP